MVSQTEYYPERPGVGFGAIYGGTYINFSRIDSKNISQGAPLERVGQCRYNPFTLQNSC